VNTIDPDLGLAHRLADAADAIALRHFAAGDTAWRAKSDGSPVSAADEQIELALRTQILRERPGDAVLGEEFGISGAGRRRWIIDAVDGTASFLAGEPEWSTLIALEEHGCVTLGLESPPLPCTGAGGPGAEPAPGHARPPAPHPAPPNHS
jgi:histidinol-phosphatase